MIARSTGKATIISEKSINSTRHLLYWREAVS
jgi:hypothetical protein